MTKGHVGCGIISALLAMSECQNQTDGAAFPANRIAHVSLVLKDGRRLTSDPTEASGDPKTQASLQDVRKKYYAWASPVIGATRTKAMSKAIDALGTGAKNTLNDLILAPAEGPDK